MSVRQITPLVRTLRFPYSCFFRRLGCCVGRRESPQRVWRRPPVKCSHAQSQLNMAANVSAEMHIFLQNIKVGPPTARPTTAFADGAAPGHRIGTSRL
jgi:hypothetical protein